MISYLKVTSLTGGSLEQPHPLKQIHGGTPPEPQIPGWMHSICQTKLDLSVMNQFLGFRTRGCLRINPKDRLRP